MLTISERKALHEHNVAPIKATYPRFTPRTDDSGALAQKTGPSYSRSNDTAVGIFYGVMLSVVFFWLPLAVVIFG